ncbi:MAG: hypothetical protein IJN66_04055 [Muribaculaceae bacterium]|nr:hypothetical protein [Muribaculaceae bacterium]
MRKWILTTLLLCIVPILFFTLKNEDIIVKPSPLKVSSGDLWHMDLFSPEMNETIKVDIWTPERYTINKDYPVIYMHDGQNLFDATSTWNRQAWEIDSVAGILMRDSIIPPAIVVGIYSTDTTRLGDLMPEKPLQYLQNDTIKNFIDMMCRGNYRADEYLAFIVNTLKPVIDRNFSTDTALISTSIMGSSMGGLISIYGMCEYPQVFGSAACLSTHWTGALGGNEDFPRVMRGYLTEKLPQDTIHRLYMDNGDCPYDSVYTPYFLEMVALADSLGYKDERLKSAIYKGHAHNEKSWSKRVEIPLTFLLNNEK